MSNPSSCQAPKYHGLVNQGATCYLNSVLQVLFMTKDFREAVKSSTDENPESIDRHLRSLFGDLQKYSAYTFNITRALGINTVYEQRDAAEYIEKILRLTSDGASQVFHGLVSQRTTCCKCGTKTDRDEAFWHLPLALVDSCSDVYSVVDGVSNFFRVSDFSGGQIYCDSCDDKVDATAQYVMKHHPDVLILLLKRFEFDYRYMSYVKINCAVDVPSTIQIPEGQTYKLYAFVDHSGDLRGGHYTATIKDEDEDRWYNFNDSRVSLYNSQPFQNDNMERSCTAQLLFYRKMEEAVIQDKSTDRNEYEATEKARRRDEGGVHVETGDDTAVAVSVGENEVIGNEGVGTPKNQEDNEERKNDYHQDASVNMQNREEGTQREDDEEDMRRQAEDDNQTQNARLASVEIKQTERIKNEAAESDTEREMRLNAHLKLEISVPPEIRVDLNQQEETNGAQSRITVKEEMTGGKGSGKPPMDDFNRDAEHLSEGGLDKWNRNKGQDSSLKTGQHEDEEIIINNEGNTERKTGANEFKSESIKSSTEHDSKCEQRRRSRFDKSHEQQKKDERREVIASNKQQRQNLDNICDRDENPDNGRPCDAQPNISRSPSVELVYVVKDGNVETHIYEVKKNKNRHVKDEKGEKNDNQRDGGREQRIGSGRKGSERGKNKDRGRLDEGIRQKNVKKQAEEKEENRDLEQFHNRENSGPEGTIRGERENQEGGSGRRRFHNKVQDNQTDVALVQLSDKDAGPAKTNKDRRIISCIRRFFKRDKKRTGAAEETSNSSYHDQQPDSLIEHASSLMQTELPVRESKTRKIWRTKKQHGERKEKEKKELKGKKKKSMKQKTPGCFPFAFKRSEKNRVEFRRGLRGHRVSQTFNI